MEKATNSYITRITWNKDGWKELKLHLQRQFPNATVTREENYVDLTVAENGRRLLAEVKSATSARRAIRQAIGQLLDYAYFENKRRIELFIIGRGALDEATKRYVDFLRRTFALSLQY